MIIIAKFYVNPSMVYGLAKVGKAHVLIGNKKMFIRRCLSMSRVFWAVKIKYETVQNQ
jgi:hypothetical protein